jgi:diaminopimelate epimerase
MCGNGGRCLVNFAKSLHIIDTETNFLAVDGAHYAKISENLVSLKMIDVADINSLTNALTLNSGSPHYIQFVNGIYNFPVFAEGKKIRTSEVYINEGIKVNFVEKLTNSLFVRTYERGVEDETLSCGTGATATAIAMNVIGKTKSDAIDINVEGGKLKVTFEKTNKGFEKVFLIGPATFVFEGTLNI